MVIRIGELIIDDDIKAITKNESPEGESHFAIVTPSQSYRLNFPINNLNSLDIENYINLFRKKLYIKFFTHIPKEREKDISGIWNNFAYDYDGSIIGDLFGPLKIKFSCSLKSGLSGFEGFLEFIPINDIAYYPDVFNDIVENLQQYFLTIFKNDKYQAPTILTPSGIGFSRDQMLDLKYGKLEVLSNDEMVEIIKSYFKLYIFLNS